MIHIVVYYGDSGVIGVSIDDMPSVDTRKALNQIIKEGELTPVPTDPFGPCYEYNKHTNGGRSFFKVAPRFDWKTITEEDLQEILRSNILSLEQYLRDSDIDIQCIRGMPSDV